MPDTTAPSESSDRYEDIAEETEHSTSLRSSKRGRQDDEEVTSKHTSSGDLIMEEGHSKEVLNVSDRKSTRLNSSHITRSRMPSSA